MTLTTSALCCLLHVFVLTVLSCAMNPTKHRVFVYGTLKRNQPNYDLIANKSNGEAAFLGEAYTIEKYPLVIASKYNIPFILDQAGSGNNIKGEVYEINDEMFRNFDILEGYPEFYWRKKISVSLSGCREQTDAWIYLLKTGTFKPSLLALPMMADYSSTGPHGLEYLEKSERLIEGYHPKNDVLNVVVNQ